MRHVAIFWRGFLIVTLTASNIGQIAGRHWVGAFIGGFGISFVWWMNSKSAAHSELPMARECYALGAGMGTVFGMWLVRAWYG